MDALVSVIHEANIPLKSATSIQNDSGEPIGFAGGSVAG
jgi:hypothetical protein